MDGIKEPQSSYLSIKNLWKSFGSFIALEDVSLDIQEGEFVCFLGPSGCGKTTLLRCIAGLETQTAGSVIQKNIDISNEPPSNRDFGIVFQSYALFPNLSVFSNISYGLINNKCTGACKPGSYSIAGSGKTSNCTNSFYKSYKGDSKSFTRRRVN